MKIKAIFQIIVMIFSIFSIISLSSENVNAVNGCCELTKPVAPVTEGTICGTVFDMGGSAGCDTTEQKNDKKTWTPKQAPAYCESTSFCKLGCELDFDNGFCYPNKYKGYVTKDLFDGKNVAFADSATCDVPQCKKGCCLVGTQAGLMTQIGCKNAVKPYSELKMDFRSEVTDETQCLNLARSQEKGCCVVSQDSCKYTTRGECNLATATEKSGTGFFSKTACSDSSRVNCECTSTDKKGCIDGQEDVYWFDSCGNIDVSKGINGKCNPKTDENCGIAEDCDYAGGDLCGKDPANNKNSKCLSIDCPSGKLIDKKKVYSFDLNGYVGTGYPDLKDLKNGLIKKLTEGEGVRNGESWCIYDVPEQTYSNQDISKGGRDPVGSRYYSSACINGKEFIEPCKDYRQELCIDATNIIDTGASGKHPYTESKCVENRWQECTDKCNTANPFTMGGDAYKEALAKDAECCLDTNLRDCSWFGSKCVPKASPGAKFWSDEGAETCAKANAACNVGFVCEGWDSITNTCGGDPKSKRALTMASKIAASTLLGCAMGGPMGCIGGLAASAVMEGVKQFTDENAKNPGWKLVYGEQCLTEEYLQATNNLCRSYGDCGFDYNYIGSEDLLIKNGINAFGNYLSDNGFKNTEKLKDEYFKAQGSKKGVDLKGNPKNLTAYDGPRWNEGTTFLDSTYEEKSNPRLEQRIFGLKASDGSYNNGQWTSSVFTKQFVLTTTTVVVPFFVKGIGGVGVSPLGYLISYPIEWLGGQATAKVLRTIGRGTNKQVLKGVSEETIKANAKKEFMEKAQENAAEKAYDEASSEYLKTQARSTIYSTDPLGGYSPNVLTKAHGKGVNAAQGAAENTAASQSVQAEAEKAGEEAAKNVASGGANFANFLSGVSAAGWVDLVYEGVNIGATQYKNEQIKTTCTPWKAPKVTVEDQCEKCNPSYYQKGNDDKNEIRQLKTCSEYTCKALGNSCELLNAGTGNELCYSKQRADVSSPVITPWETGFSTSYTKSLLPTPADFKRGFRVLYNNGNEVKAYTPFNIAIQTDEPSKCKMSLTNNKPFKDMGEFYFGGNDFAYYHTQAITFPNVAAVTQPGTLGVSSGGPGNYNIYLRCQDGSENVNDRDYVIRINVQKGDDKTAPVMEGTSIASGSYVVHNADNLDIQLYVNEPAYCKWSRTDWKSVAEFDTDPAGIPMSEGGKCSESSLIQAYTCSAMNTKALPLNRGVENKFYFRCKDVAGNINSKSFELLLNPSEPLIIDKIEPSAAEIFGAVNTAGTHIPVQISVWTKIGVNKDGNSSCEYSSIEWNNVNIAPTVPNSASYKKFDDPSLIGIYKGVTNAPLHKVNVSVEASAIGVKNSIYVRCIDKAGNVADKDINNAPANITFIAKAASAPNIVSVYEKDNLLVINTDIDSNCAYVLEGGAFSGADLSGGNVMPTDKSKVHVATYKEDQQYNIRCVDATTGQKLNPYIIYT